MLELNRFVDSLKNKSSINFCAVFNLIFYTQTIPKASKFNLLLFFFNQSSFCLCFCLCFSDNSLKCFLVYYFLTQHYFFA